MSHAPRQEAGAVLLMVLVALALLAAVAAAAARLSASALATTRSETLLLKDQLALPSALALVAARMNGRDPLPGNGTPTRLTLPDRKLEARIFSVAGLVNPNTAPRPLLIALFRSADTPPLRAETLADRILDRRAKATSAQAGRAFLLASDLRHLLADEPALWPRLRELTTCLGANVNFDAGSAPARLAAVAPAASLGSVDLYAGAATQDSAGFYELYLRDTDPPRGGTTHVSLRITADGYQVAAIDWPLDPTDDTGMPAR